MTSPKRILLLDTGNEWGGGTNSMFELLKRIDRTRFDVTCCFYKDYKKGQSGRLLSEELADIGIPLILLPTRRHPLWAKLAKEVVRGLLSWSGCLKKRAVQAIEMQWRIKPRVAALKLLLKEGGYDLLYMNNQPSSNLEGYLAAEQLCLPVVQHARIDVPLSSYEIDVVNRTAHRVICNSFGLSDSLKKQGVNEDRLIVVHNGIDLSTILPNKHPFVLEPDELILGTVGSLVSRKCVDQLIVCLAKLINEFHIKSRLVVVGEGPELERLKKLSAQYAVESKVIFTGFSQNPLEWIQLFDVFLFASQQEGFGRVLIEAMLCKVPVISADVVGPAEVVDHGNTGFLFSHGNLSELTKYVLRINDDPALRRQLGEAGFQRVRDKFSIEAYVTGVMNVLGGAMS
jgi:glycosyltransferase involved in cell wall biosynthesis